MTDQQQGPPFRLPAEWEPHAATWIAWPHNEDDWPGKFACIPWLYVGIVRHLSRVERVCILVNDEATEKQAASLLQRAGVDGRQVKFFQVATDRVWTRDYGPIFVHDATGHLTITNWKFNAWAKYENWQHDDAVPDQIAKFLSLPQRKPMWKDKPIVLEGGSIDVNGQGTLLTTEECLLSEVQARNPGMTRTDWQSVFAENLGIRKTIWLARGIAGDDTHGHVDDIARFVNPTTIVAAVEHDRDDPNFDPLMDNLELLSAASDQSGHHLNVIALPMPSPVYFDGQRLPASYVNFYIAGKLVLMPTFNDERDRLALNRLAEVFPDRAVIGIYCGDLVWGLGAIHCMTQQEPRGADPQPA